MTGANDTQHRLIRHGIELNASADRGRLALFLALVLLVASHGAEAQEAGKARRIGVLSGGSASFSEIDGLKRGFREHGYVEGQNLLVEWRFAEGRTDRLAGFAAELVRLRVELIVTTSTAAALAVKKETTTIPIVFTVVADPVGAGLVASLARPGGNITGLTNVGHDLTGKRLELLKEAVPSLKSVTLLGGPFPSFNEVALQEARKGARTLGLEVRLVEVRRADELEPPFTAVGQPGTGGVVLVPNSLFATFGDRIGAVAIKHKVPIVAWTSTWVTKRPGIYMAYGVSNVDLGRRTIGHVAKILNGAKPSDLPVEQPTKFELAISRKMARVLRLTIPQSLLLRADQLVD